MAEFLLEIRSEEIPARMQVRAGADLRRLVEAGLKEAGLDWLPDEGVSVFTGPRRIGLAGHLPERSPDVSEERKGPRVGSPERAIEGFMRGAGLSDISEAEIRSDKKGEHYVAVVETPGRDTADILAELLPKIMADFPWPKSMKSGASTFRWVRPLRSIIALLDGEVIPFEIGGISSGRTTVGHRQMGPGPFEIGTDPDEVLGTIGEYVQTLQGQGRVVLEHDTRAQLIRDGARAVCREAGLEWVEDEGLLAEVAGLVEQPVVLLGDMDPAFLELPDEVIRLTLKSHQKTFTVRDGDGQLAPHFVIVANLETPDEGATIKAGNAKVIGARLADARFFQEEDRKQPLASYYDKLDTVVFHKKLGTIRDKAERVAALAREIALHVGADPDVAEAAAKLAKCDLVTQTVIEFTSLQGQVGRMMYEHDVALGRGDLSLSSSGRLDRPAHLPTTDGLGDGPADQVGGSGTLSEADHAAIARAIEDHYKPQGPSDAVPTEPVSIAVALADKLDTLVGFWVIDEKPTGSKDPYALRRAALGLIRLIVPSEISLQISDFLVAAKRRIVQREAHRQIESTRDILEALDQDFEPTVATEWASDLIWIPDLLAFFHDRLRVYLRDQGHRHDIVDAVISQGGDDLLAIAQRVEALGGLLGTEEGENLVQGYKRAANILKAEAKKGGGDAPSPAPVAGDYIAPEARSLAKALSAAGPAIHAQLAANDYPAALTTLADLREPIDAFFEAVMVNDPDADVRARRLALLSAVTDTFHRIADFSKLDG